MALITDPDDLNQGTEVDFDVTGLQITLNQAGNLSTDGVTLKALYSFCKEEWKDDTGLISFPFPFIPITDERFEMVQGWDFDDDATRQLVRTGGWAVVDTGGTTLSEYAGIITLGNLVDNVDQAYYHNDTGLQRIDFTFSGSVNEAINTFTGSDDFRNFKKLFVRSFGRLFDDVTLDDIGVTTMAPQVYRFPLTTATDPKISATEDTITGGNPPYNNMAIFYHTGVVQRTIGASDFDFDIIISGNNGTLEQIYEFANSQLRKDVDIDTGTEQDAALQTGITGEIADLLLTFVGDNLITASGVYIDDFLSVDTNRLTFTDVSGQTRNFPFTATLTLNFGQNAQDDADQTFYVYFTNDDAGDDSGFDYGTTGAIIVQDDTGGDMTGILGGSSSQAFSYAYDTNSQRGPTSTGTDAPVTAVSIGLGTGQFVSAVGTIARSSTNAVSLIAALERNYDNP